MVLRCNTRSVPCDRNCRSAKSNAPCMMCINTCGIEWKSSSKK